MNWFKPKFSVCRECGTHYEPVTGYEARWGHLCAIHRKPVMERDLRKDAVIAWAAGNWEKLEPMYLKEVEENKAAYMAAQQCGFRDMAGAQQNALNAKGSIGVLRGLGLFGS